MANNFADDARIIEFWRFENNLTAGKAGNDLTAGGSGVAYESGSPLEGNYSLDSLANNFAYRVDADLSSGFPLKSGDTAKTGSWCCWIKPAVIGTSIVPKYMISKYNSTAGSRSLTFLTYNLNLSLAWGYNSGASAETWQICSATADETYHVGIAFNGVSKEVTVRIYTLSTDSAATYTHTFANELNVENASFVVGNRSDLDVSYSYNGLIDEVVVANDELTADEFDQIRQGTFGASVLFTKGSYTVLPSDNVNLNVDYTDQDVLDVGSDDDTRVGQIAYGVYALHQFKKLVVGTKATIKSNVRSDISCQDSAVYLQIYNHDTPEWETIDSDSTTGADTDFNLEAVVSDLTNYKDGENLVSCRVYQGAP